MQYFVKKSKNVGLSYVISMPLSFDLHVQHLSEREYSIHIFKQLKWTSFCVPVIVNNQNEKQPDLNIPQHMHGEMNGLLVSKHIRQEGASSNDWVIFKSSLIYGQLN